MFKNAILYRISPAWQPNWAETADRLQAARFNECGPTQARSIGWVEPRGTPHGPLVESVGGQWLLELTVETKVLPSAVVKRRADAAEDRARERAQAGPQTDEGPAGKRRRSSSCRWRSRSVPRSASGSIRPAASLSSTPAARRAPTRR